MFISKRKRYSPQYKGQIVDLVRRSKSSCRQAVKSPWTARHWRLTRKKYAVPVMLLRHIDRVVSQHQLLREIWDASHVLDTHYLPIVIGRLRHKLGDDPAAPK